MSKSMVKILSLALALLMLAGCASTPATVPSTVPSTEPQTVPVTTPVTVPTTTPATVPQTVPATTPATVPSTTPATEPSNAPSTELDYDSMFELLDGPPFSEYVLFESELVHGIPSPNGKIMGFNYGLMGWLSNDEVLLVAYPLIYNEQQDRMASEGIKCIYSYNISSGVYTLLHKECIGSGVWFKEITAQGELCFGVGDTHNPEEYRFYDLEFQLKETVKNPAMEKRYDGTFLKNATLSPDKKTWCYTAYSPGASFIALCVYDAQTGEETVLMEIGKENQQQCVSIFDMDKHFWKSTPWDGQLEEMGVDAELVEQILASDYDPILLKQAEQQLLAKGMGIPTAQKGSGSDFVASVSPPTFSPNGEFIFFLTFNERGWANGYGYTSVDGEKTGYTLVPIATEENLSARGFWGENNQLMVWLGVHYTSKDSITFPVDSMVNIDCDRQQEHLLWSSEDLSSHSHLWKIGSWPYSGGGFVFQIDSNEQKVFLRKIQLDTGLFSEITINKNWAFEMRYTVGWDYSFSPDKTKALVLLSFLYTKDSWGTRANGKPKFNSVPGLYLFDFEKAFSDFEKGNYVEQIAVFYEGDYTFDVKLDENGQWDVTVVSMLEGYHQGNRELADPSFLEKLRQADSRLKDLPDKMAKGQAYEIYYHLPLDEETKKSLRILYNIDEETLSKWTKGDATLYYYKTNEKTNQSQNEAYVSQCTAQEYEDALNRLQITQAQLTTLKNRGFWPADIVKMTRQELIDFFEELPNEGI